MKAFPDIRLAYEAGVLTSDGPGGVRRTWARPAALAEARLACAPAPTALAIGTGREALEAVYRLLPFAAGPLPPPVFGAGVTPAAQAAFSLLAEEGADDFRVLRGEIDDFVVFARRTGGVWRAGALVADEGALTLRFEDLWTLMPPEVRVRTYRVETFHDDLVKGGSVRETLAGVAPDARIFFDVAAGGGFTAVFTPEEAV